MKNHYEKIWHTISLIPLGRVATYGQIADLSGLPKRARLVSKALSLAAPELQLPWFRVIAAGGRIAIPKSSPGHRRQIEKLASEGVILSGARVDMKRYQWQPSLAEILQGLDG